MYIDECLLFIYERNHLTLTPRSVHIRTYNGGSRTFSPTFSPFELSMGKEVLFLHTTNKTQATHIDILEGENASTHTYNSYHTTRFAPT